MLRATRAAHVSSSRLLHKRASWVGELMRAAAPVETVSELRADLRSALPAACFQHSRFPSSSLNLCATGAIRWRRVVRDNNPPSGDEGFLLCS